MVTLPRRRGALIAASVLAYLAALLAVDQAVDSSGQLLLGGVTWVALALAATQLAPALRLQVAFVVLFATCTEVLGSIVWGVYAYRLGNLPSFVPPGHGLVYIGGIALAAACSRRQHLLTRGALLAVLVWGIAGLTVLPRTDVGGAIGCAVLAAVLLAGRTPVYAGVFAVVALLELYGTAIGTWTWAASVPGLGIENGNPPSGVGSGYVLFDVLAAVAAARIGASGALRAGPRLCHKLQDRPRVPASLANSERAGR